jgi:anti-sigma B factor antagonist
MAPEPTFHFEVEKSEDEYKLPLTTIKCHGRLTSGATGPLKELVKSLLEIGGQHVVIDCGQLESMDSSGLGTLVGLKVTAINKGLSKLELVNLSPRVAELLKLTSLTDLLTK